MENFTFTNKSCFMRMHLIFMIISGEFKYKLQIERMICNGTSNDEQFSQFLIIYNAL